MIQVVDWPVRFSKEGVRRFERAAGPDLTLAEHLEGCGLSQEGRILIIDGKVERDLSLVPGDGAEIVVTPEIKDPVTIFFVEAALITHNKYVALAGGLLSYSIYSGITATQRRPSFGLAQIQGGMDESSPTYGWDGIRTVAEVGIPVKIVYGRHRTGGNVINQFIETDGDKQYLNLLIAAGEGEIESISDIKLNGNPIENFDGVSVAYRYGTNGQTVIPNFEDLHDVHDLNQALTQSNPQVYTTEGLDIEGFSLILSLPGGLYQVDSTNGNVLAWDVTYQVEYKVHGAGSYTDLGTFTINARNRTAIRRQFTKTGLSPAQYDIRVTRTSEDSSLVPQKNGDLLLASVDEIRTDDLAYPNTALLSIRALATDQLSGGVPNVTWVEEGIKVRMPDVKTSPTGAAVAWEDYYYDPDAEVFKRFSDSAILYWDGTTYRTEWGGNPIWCMRDLQLNTRYGLGQLVASTDLNDARILEMALYCEHRIPDGAGGYEKRYRLDVVIDSATKAPDLMSQISAAFDGFAFYSQGGFQFSIDRPMNRVQLFGMGNIVQGKFSQAWKSKNDVYNVVSVQFMNQDLDYEQDELAVTDEASLAAGDPVREKKLRVFVTKPSLAVRLGRRALWISKYINRTISLTCFPEALMCQAGERVDVSHDVPQWGFSGRVAAGSTDTTIQLGKSVELSAGVTYALLIKNAQDEFEQQTITTPAGIVSSVTVASAFAAAPDAYTHQWAIGPVATVCKPFTVVGISRQSTGEVEIQAMERNETIFDDSAPALPTSNFSLLSREIQPVTDLLLTERLVIVRDFQVEDAIDVWFTKPPLSGVHVNQYARARVYLSDDAGASWQFKGETVGESLTIADGIVDGQTYRIAVTSVTADGQESPIATAPQANIEVIGKSAPPSNISSFIAIQSRDRLVFGWTPVEDLDVVGYEIRKGNSFDLGETIVFVAGRGRGSIALDIREGADQSYWIKARDSTGNFSTTAKESVLSVEQVPFTNIVQAYEEEPGWTGTLTDLTLITAGSLVINSGLLTGTYETGVVDVGFLAPFKIGISAVVTNAGSDARFDDDATKRFDDSDTARFSGEEIAGAATFEVKTSEDNITWTAYAPWIAGDYNCRYFQIRMTLARASEAIALECSQLHYYADLPDVDEFGDLTIASADLAGGKSLTFAKTYHQTPAIAWQSLGATPLVIAYSTDPDLTDATVKAYDLGGVQRTGSFRYHIHGV